jgi:hypothetical protein
MNDIVAIYMDEVTNIKNFTNIVPAITFVPLPTVMSAHFSQNGGNALGVTSADGPLVSKSAVSFPQLLILPNGACVNI